MCSLQAGLRASDPWLSVCIRWGDFRNRLMSVFASLRRFYLEIVGRRRFRIQSASEQDGYRVAVPEWFRDDPPAEGSEDANELPTLAKEVLELTAKLTDSLRCAFCAAPAPGVLDMVSYPHSMLCIFDHPLFQLLLYNIGKLGCASVG